MVLPAGRSRGFELPEHLARHWGRPRYRGWVLLPALRSMPAGRPRRQGADRSGCDRSRKELPDGLCRSWKLG
jgi:hypothetical protein